MLPLYRALECRECHALEHHAPAEVVRALLAAHPRAAFWNPWGLRFTLQCAFPKLFRAAEMEPDDLSDSGSSDSCSDVSWHSCASCASELAAQPLRA